MKKSLVRKGLVFGIIVLFVGASIIPSTVGIIEEKTAFTGLNSRGDILYVGGSGPDNYSKIQDAINDANNGDTVFVYNGTYFESINIDKKLNIMGENKSITIIDGVKNNNVIYVLADHVTINGFTIQNSGSGFLYSSAGISIKANYTTISGNIIINNEEIGIAIKDSKAKHNSIIDNQISYNNIGISTGVHYTLLWIVFYPPSPEYHNISNNIISNNALCGLNLLDTTGNTITNNLFENCGIFGDYFRDNIIQNNSLNSKSLMYLQNKHNLQIDNVSQLICVDCENISISGLHIINASAGIILDSCSNCKIYKNQFCQNSIYGLYLFESSQIEIFENMFSTNGNHGIILTEKSTQNTITNNSISNNKIGIGIYEKSSKNLIKQNNIIGNNIQGYFENVFFNKWRRNYWDDLGNALFKAIEGIFQIDILIFLIDIPLKNFDWFPVREPYDIPKIVI